MKTENSENLPLEHIVKSGRDFLHYKFIIRNTFAEPAKLKPVKSSDSWNDQESPTYNLDNHSIENIVETVNRLGIPATIDISFKPISSSYTPSPIRIDVFPVAIELNKDDIKFVNEYIYSQREDYARELADSLRAQGVDIDALVAQKIEIIKEQIRRTIIWEYLVEKRLLSKNEMTQNKLKWIEGLNIIDDHYDLRKIAASDIEVKELSRIIPDEYSGTFFSDSVYVEAIEKFSRELQTLRNQTGLDTVFALKTPGKHVMGLQVGHTPEEIERIVRFDKLLAESEISQSQFETIIERYKRVVPRPPQQKPPTKPGDQNPSQPIFE